MARGRFISSGIASDQRVNALKDDTSRVAFTWLITFADAEGRTHGDPAMVRSLVFPRRTDVSIEQMQAYITEWAEAGLIRWYEANGDLWIDFPKFDKYQTGLRKDREQRSQIPPHTSGVTHQVTPELVRSDSGVSPAQIKYKLSINQANTSSPDGESGDIKPERKPTERQTAIATLEAHFSEVSGIPCPPREKEKEKKAAATRWWNPLGNLWVLCKQDTDRALKLIDSAYQKMRNDKLTISAPQSIEQVAIALFSQNGNGANHAATQKPDQHTIEVGARINAQRNGTSYESELARLQAEYA